MTDDTSKPDLAAQSVEKAASDLKEHWSSVRIFVTNGDDAMNTGAYTTGRGDFYAQIGMVGQWLVRQNARARREECSDDDKKD